LWRKRFIWLGLSSCVFVAYVLFSWRQGIEEAALSVAGNIIASAIVGIVLLLFWDKLLRKTTFFPSDEVSFLTHRKLARKELETYEANRYDKLLDTIQSHLDNNEGKKLFSFLLMGPEQSGKTSFSLFVNGNPKYRRKYLALEVPYAAIADNPEALDEVFHWLCEGDEGERIQCRIIVFHAGNNVRQVNELVDKLGIIQERFRKIGGDGGASVRHKILLMVQFTGRRPLEAISSDFNWDEVLDGTLLLNYISPDWILEECNKPGGSGANVARELYLHTLGIPDWYNALKDSRNRDELFLARWHYLGHWFANSGNAVLPKTFCPENASWPRIVQTRCPDSLPFRFLANTYLLEKTYHAQSRLGAALLRFLNEELPAMDLVSGRKTVRLIGQRFFEPLSDAFLLYHGYLPSVVRSETVSRTGSTPEKMTFREMVPELMNTVLTWQNSEGTNEEYLRRRLMIEFFVSFLRYLSSCNIRMEKETEAKFEKRLEECLRAVIDEKDSGYADAALVLSLLMGRHGEIVTKQVIADLESLAHPHMVKLTGLLRHSVDGEEDAMGRAQRFLDFTARCDELYPGHLPRLVEILFFHAVTKLYQQFVHAYAGNALNQESVPEPEQKRLDSLVFHRLEQCIRSFRRLACRSQDVYIINKLVELDTLRLAFSRPTGYAGVAKVVQRELTDKYAFFYDSKDFLECRSWLRKTLCTVQIAKKEWTGKDEYENFELPEYDRRWETILHPSELWMANHAAQQAFLLTKHGHSVKRDYQKLILNDLTRRLLWYRDLKESSPSNPVAKRFENELLFAQINYLTYCDLAFPESSEGDWKGLDLDCSKQELAELAEFCKEGLIGAQRKLWGALPNDPREYRRLTDSACRLARFVAIAFGRNLMDKNPLLFVDPLSVGVGKAEDTVLFKGKFSDRDILVEEAKRILAANGRLSAEVLQWLEPAKAESAN
jgi:hypothetical protein